MYCTSHNFSSLYCSALMWDLEGENILGYPCCPSPNSPPYLAKISVYYQTSNLKKMKKKRYIVIHHLYVNCGLILCLIFLSPAFFLFVVVFSNFQHFCCRLYIFFSVAFKFFKVMVLFYLEYFCLPVLFSNSPFHCCNLSFSLMSFIFFAFSLFNFQCQKQSL